MATDLQFPTPPISDRTFSPSSSSKPTILRPKATTTNNLTPKSKSNFIGSSSTLNSPAKEVSFTPTGVEHRLCIPTSPPPAPKRPRAEGRPCKRRLDFFDAANTKEVDDFFTAKFAEIHSRRLLKKRCPCT